MLSSWQVYAACLTQRSALRELLTAGLQQRLSCGSFKKSILCFLFALKAKDYKP